jgi:hypothetical protein
MIYTERRDEYLRRAADAKAQKLKANDPIAKDAWERIAVSYQELANLAPGRESRWHA